MSCCTVVPIFGHPDASDEDIFEWQEAYERAVDGLAPYPSSVDDNWKELLREATLTWVKP